MSWWKEAQDSQERAETAAELGIYDYGHEYNTLHGLDANGQVTSASFNFDREAVTQQISGYRLAEREAINSALQEGEEKSRLLQELIISGAKKSEIIAFAKRIANVAEFSDHVNGWVRQRNFRSVQAVEQDVNKKVRPNSFSEMPRTESKPIVSYIDGDTGEPVYERDWRGRVKYHDVPIAIERTIHDRDENQEFNIDLLGQAVNSFSSANDRTLTQSVSQAGFPEGNGGTSDVFKQYKTPDGVTHRAQKPLSRLQRLMKRR